MAATVRVNDRTVVHEKSDGLTIAFPDACIVPAVGPLPFINVATSADSANTSATVYADGKCVMLKDSYFAKSCGDEPGTGGGVVSGVWNGKASFSNYSYDVMVEGRNVARLGDPMLHNHGSPGNALNPAEIQPNAGGGGAHKELLCGVFCTCLAAGGKTDCCRRMLAEERWRNDPPGPRRYWDPRVPGVYVEVPYDMRKTPPQPMMDKKTGDPNSTDERSTNPGMRDRTDPSKGMPLPGGDIPWVPGSRRPDVVTVKNPALPIDAPGNVDTVYDFKFGDDDWRIGQLEAYEKISLDSNVQKISVETCDCPTKDPERDWQRYPVPFPQQKPIEDKDKFRVERPLSLPEKIALGVAAIALAILGRRLPGLPNPSPAGGPFGPRGGEPPES